MATSEKMEERMEIGEMRSLEVKQETPRPECTSICKENTSETLQRQPPLRATQQEESLQDQTPMAESMQASAPDVEYFLGERVQHEEKDGGRLTVVTWNIDGLDLEELPKRAGGLFCNIKKHRPDVMLLQELIPRHVQFIRKHFVNYDFLQGRDKGYYTGIMLRRSRVRLLHSDIVNYRTTEMKRNLLLAHVNFFGHELCVMTSHLESCKENSQERINQLRRVWTRIKEVPEHVTVIFGGDTNLRDWEVKKLGGLPDGISDVWEVLGKPEDCRYTWDTEANDNKDIPCSVKLRFDRVFIRAAKGGTPVVPESMALIGQERLRCGFFTSDHWGILCKFSVGPQVILQKSVCGRKRKCKRGKVNEDGGPAEIVHFHCHQGNGSKEAGDEMGKVEENKEQQDPEGKSVHDGDTNTSDQGQSLQSVTQQEQYSQDQAPTPEAVQASAPDVECFLGEPVQDEVEDRHRLSVLTWNINGKHKEALLKRAGGLFFNIKKYRPDVILLQEINRVQLRILEKHFQNYLVLEADSACIMVRKSRVQCEHTHLTRIPTMEILRFLPTAKVNILGHNLYVMTSHLESYKVNSDERLDQVRSLWELMKGAPDNTTIIFGGDTNLRNWEVEKLGGPPEGISDVWEVLGKPEHCRYTWDATTNDNNKIPYPVRLRSDRVFVRAAKDRAMVIPESMVLIGQERLKCGFFTSSHWGVLCGFSVSPQVTLPKNICGGNEEEQQKEEEEAQQKEEEAQQRKEDVVSHDNTISGSPETQAVDCVDPDIESYIVQLFQEEEEDKGRFSVLSFNILEQDEVGHYRQIGLLICVIESYHPDIVLVQGLIPERLKTLQNLFWNYEFCQGSDNSDFTCIMLRKYRIRLLHSTVVNYPTTEMRRNLLIAHVDFYGSELCLMTSDLESGEENSQERMNQLRRVWKRMREAPDNSTVIFGGGTNLREWEVQKLGGLPEGIFDMWETRKKRVESEHTKDTTTNNDQELPHSGALPFHRVFIRAAKSGAEVVPVSLKYPRKRFHVTVLCHFTVKYQSSMTNSAHCSQRAQNSFSGGELAEADGGLTGEMQKTEQSTQVQSHQGDQVQMTEDGDGAKAANEEHQTNNDMSNQVQNTSGFPQGAGTQAASPLAPWFRERVRDKDFLTVVSWNPEGLDKDIRKRAYELFLEIDMYKPDVILLQELVPKCMRVLKEIFKYYKVLQGSEDTSFTCIMLRKYGVRLLHSTIMNYPTTQMRRNLLIAHVDFFGRELCLMTSHLESGGENSQERMNQLRGVWKRMREAPDNVPVIFAGDTNLRSWEMRKLGGLPEGISDVWEVLGRPEDCRYTWDFKVNDNKHIPNTLRLRFDRIFIRGGKSGASVVPVTMKLIGQEKLDSGLFPSSHWGVLCGFTVKPD